jgi:hypothetical protein
MAPRRPAAEFRHPHGSGLSAYPIQGSGACCAGTLCPCSIPANVAAPANLSLGGTATQGQAPRRCDLERSQASRAGRTRKLGMNRSSIDIRRRGLSGAAQPLIGSGASAYFPYLPRASPIATSTGKRSRWTIMGISRMAAWRPRDPARRTTSPSIGARVLFRRLREIASHLPDSLD